MKYYFLYVFIFLILCSNELLISQEITREEKIKIGHIVAGKIEKFYPYPEISKKVVHGIYEGFNNNAFESINTYAEFAVKMTELVEGLSNDKHLDLIYNPVLAVKMKSGDKNDNFMAEEEAEIERWNNYGFTELAILDGNIGYMNLSVFFDLAYASKTADHAMGYFANSNGLIIDLRQNGG